MKVPRAGKNPISARPGQTCARGPSAQPPAPQISRPAWMPYRPAFRHPALARSLEDIVHRPAAVAPDHLLAPTLQERISDIAKKLVYSASAVWPEGFALKNEPSPEALMAMLCDRVSAATRCVPDFAADICALPLMQAPKVASSAAPETFGPHLAGPMEGALILLAGLVDRYARWGNDGLSPRDNFNSIVPGASYQIIGSEFLLMIWPGMHESSAGIDVTLAWRRHEWEMNADASWFGTPIATAGIIRRPTGWALVKIQGGQGIATTDMVDRTGRSRKLLSYAKRRFHGDPRVWLARQVLRMYQRDYPESPLYWRRGEALRWLFLNMSSPSSERHFWDWLGPHAVDDIGALLSARAEVITNEYAWLQQAAGNRTLNATEREYLGTYEHDIQRVAKAMRVTRFYNDTAAAFGFHRDEGDHYYRLHPAEMAWEALKVFRQGDIDLPDRGLS